MTPRIVGLDISTKRIGVALPNGRLRSISTGIVEHADDHALVPARRNLTMTNRLGSMLRALPETPTLALVESPFVGGNSKKTTLRLVELGGCIRMALAALDIPFVEVLPVHVKQWATGKAAASKADMISAARSMGAEPADDDQADAFWLRDLGVSYFESDWSHFSELQRLILATRVKFPAVSHT